MTLRAGLITALLGFAAVAHAQTPPPDGADLYKRTCAPCHEQRHERAPNRDAFQSMSAERVLAAMETGSMISMASSRTGRRAPRDRRVRHRQAVRGAALTTPSPQAMCRGGAGRVQSATPARRWTGWGANTQQHAIPGRRAAGLTAADVPKLKLKWAFAFPGDLQRRRAADDRRWARVRRQLGAARCTRSTPRPAASTGSSMPASGARSAISIGRVDVAGIALRRVLRRSRGQRLRARRRHRRADLEDRRRRLSGRPRQRIADASQRPALCRRRVR